jgi:hypothetical protein
LEHVIAIAETLGAPVWDCNSRLNFPSNHPLNLSMAPKECYDGSDVVLALDIADFEGPTHVRDIATRSVVNMVPETATWIDIGFTDVELSKWSMDYGRTFRAHHRMTADPVIGTTVYHWARVATQRDPKCRARYTAMRKRGHSHGRALRGVAGRLLALACVLLQRQTLFDPYFGRLTT